MARSRARKLADLTSAGNTFDDGVISAAEVTGLGTAATTAATDYATAGQGTLAASALQSGGGSVTGNVTFGGNVSVDGGTIKLDGNYPVGSNNVALGDAALDSNVSGGQNTAIGSDALTANTANNNTAVGYQALYANTTGAQNTAIGRLALDANTTANENTAVGNSALGANTTGASNSALGSGAMTSNTTGATNVAIGDSALYSNTTASQNTAVGYQAGYSNTTGTNNTNFGHLAGYTNTTGQRNAYIGQGAGYSMTTGSKNSILGSYNGNQDGLDIRTSSNNIVLSDGDGNVRAHCDSSGTWTGVGASTTYGAVGTYVTAMRQLQNSATGGPTYTGGDTVAGSSLLKWDENGDEMYPLMTASGNTQDSSASGLSGTWRLMAPAQKAYSTNQVIGGLYVRIS